MPDPSQWSTPAPAESSQTPTPLRHDWLKPQAPSSSDWPKALALLESEVGAVVAVSRAMREPAFRMRVHRRLAALPLDRMRRAEAEARRDGGAARRAAAYGT